jgi:hypothetical protein
MNEIKFNIHGRKYRLTNENNAEKYDRAVKDAGCNASQGQILTHYDKLLGYIQNENGNKIENGQFWKAEKIRLARKEGRIKNWNKLKDWGRITVSFIKGFFVLLLFILFILAIFAWVLGYDEIIPIIKNIKDLI